MNEWVGDWVSEGVSEWFSKRLIEWLSMWVNDWVSEWVGEWVQERVFEQKYIGKLDDISRYMASKKKLKIYHCKTNINVLAISLLFMLERVVLNFCSSTNLGLMQFRFTCFNILRIKMTFRRYIWIYYTCKHIQSAQIMPLNCSFIL